MKIYGRKKESLVESTFANLGQATLQTDEKRSRKEIKINSMNLMGDPNGGMQNISNAPWMPITKAEDLRKLEEMCRNLK